MIRGASTFAPVLVSGGLPSNWSWLIYGQSPPDPSISVDQNGRSIMLGETFHSGVRLGLRRSGPRVGSTGRAAQPARRVAPHTRAGPACRVGHSKLLA
jgi:hypothetical protein